MENPFKNIVAAGIVGAAAIGATSENLPSNDIPAAPGAVQNQQEATSGNKADLGVIGIYQQHQEAVEKNAVPEKQSLFEKIKDQESFLKGLGTEIKAEHPAVALYYEAGDSVAIEPLIESLLETKAVTLVDRNAENLQQLAKEHALGHTGLLKKSYDVKYIQPDFYVAVGEGETGRVLELLNTEGVLVKEVPLLAGTDSMRQEIISAVGEEK